MSGLRVAVFLVATVLSVAAGLGVARALGPGRARGYMVTTAFWAGTIVFPAHALAMLHVLTFASLASLSIALSCGTLVFLRTKARALVADAAALALAPFSAFQLAWRRRSLILAGLVFATGFVLWSAVSAWLAPQEPTAWDPFWYHEPMAAFAIQNKSFEPVVLDPYLQRINGFPRGCETILMWFAMVFGRTLIDLPNIVIVPGLVSAVFLLCRRVCSDDLICLGMGLVILTIPGCLSNLQSSHNDPTVAFFTVAAVALALSESLRPRDVAATVWTLGLGITAKSTCLTPVFLLSFLTLGRVVLAGRTLIARARAGAIGLGLLFLLAAGSTVYLRNYLNFGNPFWPELKLDVPALGIHWPGRVPYRLPNPPPSPEAQIDVNIPMGTLIEYLYALPQSVHEFQYGYAQGYGMGVIWFLTPALLVSLGVHGASLVGGMPWAGLDRKRFLHVLAIAFLAAVLFGFTPARWAPRYHLPTVSLAAALVAALGQRGSWRPFVEAICGAALVGAMMDFHWANPPYSCTLAELVALAHLGRAEREFASSRTPYTTPEFGRLRERLHEGDLLVVRHYGLPGLMWNNAYSNRVEYVLDGPDLHAYADAQHARCVVARDPDVAAFRADTAHWREVAQVNRQWADFFAFEANTPRPVEPRVVGTAR